MAITMNEFDALIVANSPGGWVAAITLAQAGRKAALLDRVKAVPGGLIPRGGIFLQVFPALEQRLKREDQLFQFVAPGHRFGIPSVYHRFLSEIGFEFPELQGELEPVFARVQDSGRTVSDYFRIWGVETKRPDHRTLDGKFFENLSLWRQYQQVRHLNLNNLNQGLSRSRPLCRMLESPGRFSSGLFWKEEEEEMGAFSAYYRQAFFPLFSPHESKVGLVGLEEIMTALRRMARELKIEVLNPGVPVSPGDPEPGPGEETLQFKLTTVRQIKKRTEFHSWGSQGEEKPVNFRSLIWSGNSRGFIRSLPETLRKARGVKLLARHLGALEIGYLLDSLEIKVKAEVIPVGMEKRLFVIGEPDQGQTDENLIYLEVLPLQESNREEGDSRYPGESGNLLIRAAYFRSVSKSAEKVSQQVMKKVGWLIPFLKEFQVGEPTLKKGEELTDYGSSIWSNRRGLNRGKLSIPAGKAGIFYSGRELLPALGFEADLLSGLVTAWSLEKWLRKISK